VSQPPTPTYQQRIAALLRQIPEDERAVFERYYQEQLALALRDANALARDTPAGAADPDQVEATVLDDLIRRAEGRDNPDGLGEVPTADYVYEFIPPEADPRILPARGRGAVAGVGGGEMGAGRWIGLAVLALFGLVALLRMFSGGSSTPSQALASTAVALTTTPGRATTTPIIPAPTPTGFAEGAAGSDVQVVDPTSLEFGRPTGAPVVFPVVATSGQLGGAWSPAMEPGHVGWLQGTYVNSAFCLGQDARTLAHATTRGQPILMRAANGAVRRYEVARVRQVGRQQTEVLDQRRAGMTIVLCGDSGNQRTVIEAVYRPEQLPAARQYAGTDVALAELVRLRVTDAQVVTPTTDLAPGLAEARLQVQVSNLTDAALRWEDLVDQLEIGGRLAETLPTADRPPLAPKESRAAEFRYLVPTGGGAAVWRVTAPTGESVALNLQLPGAPRGQDSAAGSLQGALQPDGVWVKRTPGAPAQLVLNLVLTNGGQAPAAVEADAASVWEGSASLPLRDQSVGLPLFVQPGARQTLTLTTDYPKGKTVVVQVGAQRWQVRLP
jgi:hypothetical protein